MTDLTKIESKFGDLCKAIQWQLIGAWHCGEEIEQSDPQLGLSPHWSSCEHPAWSNCMAYRIKAAPIHKTRDFIQWASAFSCLGPCLYDEEVGEDMVAGKTTITTLDGKATRIVWEASA